MSKKPKKNLGLWMLTTLVAGNMIGSGIFLLPSNLASIGSISLFSWCITATGAFLLAIVFAKTSLIIPRAGGPYAYAQKGFGDFIGFQTAYNYWIAIWVGNAAIIVALIGYLTVFWPALEHPAFGCLLGISVLWFFTLVNIIGVKSVGVTQIVTTICKLIPIILVAILGWGYFHPEYLTQSYNISNTSNFSAITHAATLTLWAFIGLESATVPADYVDNPTRNIPLATLLGTGIAAIVYIASSAAIMGMIPANVLAQSMSPFAAAAGIIFGHWGNWLIAFGATVSCLGALNGWTLLQGQIPMVAADDNLFPKIFAKRNKDGIPVNSLLITSALITLLLLLTSSPNLINQFKIIILIAALTSLVPYLYTAISEVIMLKKGEYPHSRFHTIVAFLAAIYAFWAIFGSGEDIIFYGSMLIFSSIPLYAFVTWKKRSLA